MLLLVEDMLLELGCEVAGTASRLQEALAMAGNIECDAAILDVNINGEMIGPVAEILAARGKPFVFSTGYGKSGIAPELLDWPVLQKPYRPEDFAEALRRALERRKV